MRTLSVLVVLTFASFLIGCNGDSEDAPVDPPATNGVEAPAEPATEPAATTEEATEPAATTEEVTKPTETK